MAFLSFISSISVCLLDFLAEMYLRDRQACFELFIVEKMSLSILAELFKMGLQGDTPGISSLPGLESTWSFIGKLRRLAVIRVRQR